MRRIALGLLAMGLTACGEPLECTLDDDCGDGAYCFETTCNPVELKGQYRQSFRTQILPLIKAECNCHGPGGGRPWSFDHRPGFADSVDNFLQIEPWLWHRLQPKMGMQSLDVPVPLVGYAVGQCGFNHPGVYDPAGPKAQLLELWARAAMAAAPGDDQRAGPHPVDLDVKPLRATFTQSLPSFERRGYNRAVRIAARESYPAAVDAEILPRVLGQCGCCHDQNNYFASGVELTELERLRNRNQALNFIQAGPTAPLVSFGLGSCLRASCEDVSPHPTAYTGLADPRLLMLMAWVVDGPPLELEPVPRPDAGLPPPPPDAGPPVGDGEVVPSPPPDYLSVYTSTIAASFDRGCSPGGECHGPGQDNPWTHTPINGPNDMEAILANFIELAEPLTGDGEPRVLSQDPENCGIVQYGSGTNHPFGSPYFSDPALRAQVVSWIASLPPSFPNPPPPPPDVGPPDAPPLDAGGPDVGTPPDGGTSDAGPPPDVGPRLPKKP